MGCCKSKENLDTQGDSEAMEDFLSGGELESLWNQFDKNNDGFIDGAEFKQLIYASLKHFCHKRNPHKPPPSQNSLKPHIKKLVSDLQPFIDKDKDMKITLEEFKGYGKYLTKEFEQVQAEMNQAK